MKNYIWKHPTKLTHFLGWVQCMAQLLDAVVGILTFSCVYLGLGIKVARYRAWVAIQQAKKATIKENR